MGSHNIDELYYMLFKIPT